MTTPPPAGWYPAPEDGNVWRYWNGTAWTDRWAPRVIAGPRKRSRSALWITIGTLSAAFVSFFAILAIVVAVSPPSTTSPSPGNGTTPPEARSSEAVPSTDSANPPSSAAPEQTPDLDMATQWPPGFQWTWLGGPVAYKFLEPDEITCPEDGTAYEWCWTLKAASRKDCPSGIRIQGYFLDIYGRGLGEVINVTTEPVISRQITSVSLGSTYETADEFVVTETGCG